MEQDWKPRNKTKHLWLTNLWQRRQEDTVEKNIISIIRGPGKNQEATWKRMKLEHSLTLYKKIKLKMDWTPKYKAGYYKTPRGKHRQNVLRHKSQQHLVWSAS